MSQVTITEEMVLAKEQQNAAHRDELIKRSGHVRKGAEPEPNFPPECCCVKPLIYHNIREQVPVPQQRFMYILCGLYLSLIVLIIYNIVVALVCFIFAGSALQFGLSFLYLLGIPGAWVTWYYNVYAATTESSRPRQVLALFGLFLGVAFDAWMAVGVSGFGGCGWLMAIGVLNKLVCCIMAFISAGLWTVHGFFMLVMMLRYWKVSNDLLKGGKYIYRSVVI